MISNTGHNLVVQQCIKSALCSLGEENNIFVNKQAVLRRKTLYEATKVAGSDICKQSKTV